MSDIDDTSSVAALSEAVTETASQPSTLNTRSAAAGSTAFATFRGGRSVSDQLRDIDTNEIPTEVSLMSKIKIQREDYVPTEWLHRKKRARKSPIDPYGRRLTKVVGNREKGDFWLCNQCDKKKEISLYALVNSGTSGALRHLRKDHDLLVGEVDSETIGSEPPRRRQRQRTVLDLQRQAAERLAIPKPKAELFKELLLRWIVDADVPFSAVEHPDFRKLLGLSNEELVDELLPRSGVTIRSWLEAEYRSQKELLRSQLTTSMYKKHLTFDLWTSPQKYALLGVAVHFTDALKRPQTSLLALRRLCGQHSGENIGPTLREVLSEYEISAEELGYFTCDNADANDSAVNEIIAALLPDVQPQERRIRCINHIYNLGATSYLEGKLKDVLKSFESQPAEQAALQKVLNFLEEWRPTGAFVRIHNLQGWVRRSSQRREGFLQYAQGKLSDEEVDEFGEVLWEVSQLMLLQDNDTRWNSFFTAIERAFRLKDPIEIYTTVISRHADKTKRIPDEYLLSQDDWHVLAITLAVLLPFKKLTKYFEGRVPRFAEAAASLFYLVDHLRKQLAEYSDSDRVFPGPEIEGPEREIRVGDAPLRFAAAHGSSPPSSPPFSPPAAQSQRPQRSVGLPHKYRDSVIDLPGRPVGSINPPVTLEDSGAEEILEQEDEEEGSQRQRCEKWPNPPSKAEIDDVNLRAVRGCITCAIYKLEKYVTLLEDSPAYWTAMILHPAFKDKWIREYLPGQQAKRIVDSFKQFFDRDYNKLPTQPTPIQKKTKSSHLGAHSYLAQRPSPANRDEVKEYLEEPIYEDEEVEDPFEWWRQREKDFPRLARMAYDLLSIPSTACECERVFSLAKLLVGTQRHSLQDLTMEMLTCVKFWRRNPLI
ncbi:HAT, C-terminal dimerization domain [Fusarium oxysporum f. sp. vasinfectum]|nr:HAT, C-terminal dimerization domain [Fusarium oxysporum f. sp. vasinfectum]